MHNHAEIAHYIHTLRLCIIIPTYNNAKTLQRVIDGVLLFTDQVIVVNDGSTDETEAILKTYSQLHCITLSRNKGKGNALHTGFKEALRKGFHYALTIDSDGQHFPSDIPVFVNALRKSNGKVLLIGSRNLTQEGVPRRSNFGNRFSNFWFWFETGIRLSDTQSGYRLYPLLLLPRNLYTQKFEFEIEVIVRTAWKGVEVKNVPVQVLYDPEERVSHFRPYKDFTRISILNTVLVFWALAYIKPRDFVRKFKKKSWKRFLKEDVLNSEDTNEVKALSIALGTFIGIAPLWGFQTVLALFLPVVFRWNKVLSFVFSNISIPPMIPLIIYLSLKTGAIFFPNAAPFTFSSENFTFEMITEHLFQYITGSFLLASATSIVFGLLSYLFLNWYSRKQASNA